MIKARVTFEGIPTERQNNAINQLIATAGKELSALPPLMTARETNLVNQHMAELKEAIIKAVYADKSEHLTCVCIGKIVRDVSIEPLKEN